MEHMTEVERKKGSIKIWKLASTHTLAGFVIRVLTDTPASGL